jgi:hypothetical protein
MDPEENHDETWREKFRNMRTSADVIAVRSGPTEGITMINLSLRRYLPGWFRSETGDFYLTILFAAAATAELTYWCLSLPL